MPDRSAPARPPSGGELVFDERLTAPWWWWLPGLGVAVLLAAEVHLGYPGIRSWLPYLLTVPLATAVLARMGRQRVRVSGTELCVGPAHVALGHLGQVAVIPPADKRQALGPGLDPAAFLLHKAWIGPLVRAELIDPQDPTPYWIFSSRRAGELAAVLQAAIPQAGLADGRPDGPAERAHPADPPPVTGR